MKVLKAKIKKTSPYYSLGLNQKSKPVWLTITGFRVVGTKNFRINAVKGFKAGYAEYKEIWVSKDDIILRHVDEGQLSMDLYSQEEYEKQKHHPRISNRKRFEIRTKNEKQYIQAPDLEAAHHMAKQLGLSEYSITQVKRLTKKEINE